MTLQISFDFMPNAECIKMHNKDSALFKKAVADTIASQFQSAGRVSNLHVNIQDSNPIHSKNNKYNA